MAGYSLYSILTLYRRVLELSTYCVSGECDNDTVVPAEFDYSVEEINEKPFVRCQLPYAAIDDTSPSLNYNC
jgi:hypothetical protein